MKWELEDNTSDGIRFLLIGAGSLLVLRLCYSAVLMLLGVPDEDELGAAIAHFRSGYWIIATDVLVTVPSTIGTRLSLAFSTSLVFALFAAGLVYQLAMLLGKESINRWLLVLRTTLIAALVWSLFASLSLPPSTATLDARGISITRRTALFGTLSLPWSTHTVTTPWSAIKAVEVSFTEEGHIVEALTDDGALILCTGAKADAERLATAIRVRYLSL
jgi:hypothetical protein